MNGITRIKKGLIQASCALALIGVAPAALAQEKTVEEETKIHRLESTKRAIYDAFTYVNRIPEMPEEAETAEMLSGRLFGRLANQEGRILLKLPPGMSPKAYMAFKAFFRYEVDGITGSTTIGNCAACHTPANFTDNKKHIIEKGATPVETPALRNLTLDDSALTEILKAKLKASEMKKAGNADDIDDEYAKIKLEEKHIAGLVEFLNLLKDGQESDFRKLILNAEVFDTWSMNEE